MDLLAKPVGQQSPQAHPIPRHGDLLGEALLCKVPDRVVVRIGQEEFKVVLVLGILLSHHVEGTSNALHTRTTLV